MTKRITFILEAYDWMCQASDIIYPLNPKEHFKKCIRKSLFCEIAEKFSILALEKDIPFITAKQQDIEVLFVFI